LSAAVTKAECWAEKFSCCAISTLISFEDACSLSANPIEFSQQEQAKTARVPHCGARAPTRFVGRR
jgi:hypothetical protein